MDREVVAAAALRPVAGVEELQVVGALADTVIRQLGLFTDARSVWLHPDVAQHIADQRKAIKRNVDTGDAEFAFQNLAATVLRPDYCGFDARDARRIDLVRLTSPARRPLFVALKVVPATEAGPENDELWVCTAHPLGEGFLTQKRYRNTLMEVNW